MGLRARPTLATHDDETAEFGASDVTGMLRIPTNRRAERRRVLVVRVVAGLDELKYALLPTGRPLVIGRDSTVCDLVIDHPSVSRRHVTVEALPDSEALKVTDLGSTNGTWLGVTQVVGAVTVDEGDRVGVGYVTVCIESMAEEELSHLDRVERKLRSSGVDALTGLLSRGWLEDDLPPLVLEHGRSGVPLTAVFVDIDHFKSVNDTFGHATGDAVLRVVARVIADSIRTSDVAVRYGGEEFLIVLKRTIPTTGMVIAERVRRAMLSISWPDHGLVERRITLSCGVADLRAGEDQAAWLKRADDALYKAKETGRNRSVLAE